MKQLIEFDETNYRLEMSKLNRLVNGINEAMPILTDLETVTLDTLCKLATNADYIQKERYIENLKQFSKQFGAQYDKLDYQKHSHILQMARGATQYLFDAKKLIGNTERYFFTDNLIILDENTVKIAPNAEELIRAKHTHYTKNKAEAVLLEKVASITNSLNELDAEFGEYKSNNLYFYHLGEKRYKINKNVLVAFANQNR